MWAGRRAAEVEECQLHEALLNVAFADAAGFRLLCPYDTATLSAAVLHAASQSHPMLVDHGERVASRRYRCEGLLGPFGAPLAAPAGRVEVLAFERDTLGDARELAAAAA